MGIIVGTVLGFLSGLGIGGGSLLILYLTLVLDMEHSAARGINLLFFLPCACIASAMRWKEGSVDLKKIWPAIAAGCAGAAVFTWIGTQADVEILKKWFGWLLLVTGVRELLYRTQKPPAKPMIK